MTRRRFTRLSLAGALAMALLLAGRAPAFARGAAAPAGLTFIVNSDADLDDANPGDGLCATAGGMCTLRAALQEANAHPGADTIQLQPNTTYFPNHTQSGLGFTADLLITDSLTLLGAGPDSTIIDGSGVVGHRVLYITATVVISGVTVAHGSEADFGFGGGIYSDGELTLVNTDLVSNTVSGVPVGGVGGAIESAGDLTVTDSLIRGNRTSGSSGFGGGIDGVSLTLIRTTVSDNITSGGGGGVDGAGHIVDSTFSGNTAGTGGAIEQDIFPLVLINSTLSGNSATGSGGGLEALNGEADLFNTTVADNRANANGVSAGVGGGLYSSGFGTQIKLVDSLVAGNNVVQLVGHFPRLNPDDCAGSIQAEGFNLIGFIDTSHCAVTGAPLSGDPLLGPLQANGGPTFTQALLPGSPAIDAGDPVCTDDLSVPLTADQRGAPRPANGATATRCDLGAYEVQRIVSLPLVLR